MRGMYIRVLILWLGALAGPAGVGAQAIAGEAAPATPAAPLPMAAKPAEVKLHETLVFRLLVDRPLHPAAQRALSASRALEHAFDAGLSEVRMDTHAEARVLFVGDVPIVELYEADARAAERVSLDVYAANVAAQMRGALAAERRRSDIAATVFSISLVVFFGFVALYSLRKIGELAGRARDAIAQHPERIAPIRLHSVRVIGAGPLRAILLGGVIVGRWVLQISVVYVWLVLSLSRFEITRPYTARLNRAMIDPLSALAQRSLGSLPVLVIGFALVAAVFVGVRFVELFFMGVSRGHERVAWLPRDLVSPVSALLRIGIVVLAVIFAGPIVSDDPQGVPARLGSGVLFGLALAVTPLLCAIGWGAVLIFTRRVEVGWQVELGPYRGRVVSVGLLDVVLRAADGSLCRVPHLHSLITPLRVWSAEQRPVVELFLTPSTPPDDVIALCVSALRTDDGLEDVRVELAAVDADAARYRVSVSPRDDRSTGELRKSLVLALQRDNIAFGRVLGERNHG